jgi:hypothetical protein
LGKRNSRCCEQLLERRNINYLQPSLVGIKSESIEQSGRFNEPDAVLITKRRDSKSISMRIAPFDDAWCM